MKCQIVHVEAEGRRSEKKREKKEKANHRSRPSTLYYDATTFDPLRDTCALFWATLPQHVTRVFPPNCNSQRKKFWKRHSTHNNTNRIRPSPRPTPPSRSSRSKLSPFALIPPPLPCFHSVCRLLNLHGPLHPPRSSRHFSLPHPFPSRVRPSPRIPAPRLQASFRHRVVRFPASLPPSPFVRRP